MSAHSHRLYLLHALTPLHIGTDEGVGGIDLPTMRESHTGFPLVPGSSVKGVLRAEAELRLGKESEQVFAAFGPPKERAGDFRSGLVFTDAQLLALPVRSLYGTFAWITSPLVLQRLNRDLRLTGTADQLPVPEIAEPSTCLVPGGSTAPRSEIVAAMDGRKGIFLDELLLTTEESVEVATAAQRIGTWLWSGETRDRAYFISRFSVVPDNVFTFFARQGLEVRARVTIEEETGTAARSGPWTEEHLPAESLLVGLAIGRRTLYRSRPKDDDSSSTEREWRGSTSLDVLAGLAPGDQELRFGGHSTIGLGRARFLLVDEKTDVGAAP